MQQPMGYPPMGNNMWNYGNGGMWQVGAKLNLCDNDSNFTLNAYNIANLISTPTPLIQQPREANNQGTWTYAAASILPTISITEKNKLQWAILDSGASSHFLLADAPCVNKKPTTSPITVHLPNGQTVVSSHTCKTDLPNLPQHARVAHILSGLMNQ